MNAEEIAKYVDHERWLMNSGLISDGAKNQLFMYGSIVHKEVRAVELSIDPENKKVYYKLYVDSKLLKKHKQYMKFSTSTDLFGLWRFKRLLKKEGNLNWSFLLKQFVSAFCGPKWSVDLDIANYSDYDDGFGEDGSESAQQHTPDNKPPN